MEGCVGKDIRIVHIFAPVLKKLFIKPLHYCERDSAVFMYKIVLDTPALQYLGLNDYVAAATEGYFVKNLCHLIKADIDYGDDPVLVHTSVGTGKTLSKAFTDLLTGLSNVQFLRLHDDFVEYIDEYSDKLPTFHNLTSLELSGGFYGGWEFLTELLENSPHLETLVFEEGLDEDGALLHSLSHVPTCLVFHLKVIKILWFEGYEGELKIVEYFLKNAEVLEKLIIHSKSLIADEVKVTKKLLRLPRSSRICQVEHYRIE